MQASLLLRHIHLVALAGPVLSGPALLLSDIPSAGTRDADVWRQDPDQIVLSIPGYWEPVGDSVDPDGIFPPFGTDEVHRPAIGIQPGGPDAGQPSAVVHRYGVLEMVGANLDGDLFKVDTTTGETAPEVSASGFPANPLEGLAFDSNNDAFYGLVGIVPDNSRLVGIDYGTGNVNSITTLGLPFRGLAYDPDFGVLYAAYVKVYPGTALRADEDGGHGQPSQTAEADDLAANAASETISWPALIAITCGQALCGGEGQPERVRPTEADWYDRVISQPTPMALAATAYEIHVYAIAPQTGQKALVGYTTSSSTRYDGVTGIAYDSTFDQWYVVLFSDPLSGGTGYRLAKLSFNAQGILTLSTIGAGWGSTTPVQGLDFFRQGSSTLLYGTYGNPGQLVYISQQNGMALPIGAGFTDEIRALTQVRRQQDGLYYLEFDGADWVQHLIDNEQDGVLDDGFMTHTPAPTSIDPDEGRIDGISLVYNADGQPLVAWAQRVDDAYSDILVAIGTNGPNWQFVQVGGDAFSPSNRIPGISRSLRDSTDPRMVLDGDDQPIVAWLEEVTLNNFEVYVRRYDPDATPTEGQWVEMGEASASDDGVSQSNGTADSFDLAMYEGQVMLAFEDSGDIRLKTFNEVTEEWDDFEWNSVDGTKPSIAVYPGSPLMLVAWVDPGSPNDDVRARQWSGSGWTDLGTKVHTANLATNPSATTTPAGRMVVAWEEDLTTPWRQVLAKQWDAESWGEIGPGSASSGGISASTVDSTFPRLVSDPNNRPVIAWEEEGRAFVRRFSETVGGQPDCNENEVNDLIDLDQGDSQDCNANDIPDECEIDRGSPAPGGPFFCDADCDPDCNANGIPDECDIAGPASVDLDANGVPDECDPDCNNNGLIDACDLSCTTGACGGEPGCGLAQDCNANTVPDPCDLDSGTSDDCDTNGVPDECTISTFVADSGELSPIGNGQPQLFVVPAAPLAGSGVTITLTASADLLGVDEYLVLTINGGPATNFFQTGGHRCPDPPGPPDSQSVVVPQNTYNTLVGGGEANFLVTATATVNPSQCLPNDSYVIIHVEYDYSDCNGNGVLDACDIAAGSPDCNTNGIPDECENDCNGNCVPDDQDIGGGFSDDYNANTLPDECEDCDSNGVADACDLNCGTGNCDADPGGCESGHDCNSNGVLDACDAAAGNGADCNSNGVLDQCDLAGGTSHDYDASGVPDECEADCDANGVVDTCDLSCATGNCAAAPSCGLGDDCNSNGILDECDLAASTSLDCNSNSIPDECDIASGSSLDANTNGIPDECEAVSCTCQDARSLKTHSGAGELALTLGCLGGIEPRFDGVTKLEIDLDEISGFSGGIVVNCAPTPYGDQATESGRVGNTLTIDVPQGLPDETSCTITLDCGASVCVRNLVGDSNRDGSTNVVDNSGRKPNFGQTAAAGNAHWDVNLSGQIDVTDNSQSKARFGNSAPACP